jgi:hypothetical protein
MKAQVPEVLEVGRQKHGRFSSGRENGFNGLFSIMRGKEVLRIVSSDASDPESQGWEHVSVSCRKRCPTWAEMSFVKDLYWEPEECVVQYHPPHSEYVSNLPHVLHMWRHVSIAFPTPPSIMVGIKAVGELRGKEEAAVMKHLIDAGYSTEDIVRIIKENRKE